jgi:putative ABC transport system permease protein
VTANWIRLAFRNLGRHGRRTALTGSIVVVGFIATTMTAGFVAQTFIALKGATIKNLGGHIRVFNKEAAGKTDDEASQLLLEDWQGVGKVVSADPRVEMVMPRLSFFGLVVRGEKSATYLGTGTIPELEKKASLAAETLSKGEFMNQIDADEVMLGTGVARALGANVGDLVTVMTTTADGTLNAVDASVVAILQYPIKELDDRLLFMPYGAASRLLKSEGKCTTLVVTLKEGNEAETVLPGLEARLASHKIPVAFKTWSDSAAFYKQVRLLYLTIFSFMGLVLAIVIILAVANTMTMSVFERTREIGVMLALGMERGSVRNLFMLEGFLLGVLGSVLGAVLSLLLRALLNVSGIELPPPPGGTRGTTLFVLLIPQAYLFGFVLMTSTLLAASWWPARRASRLDPVGALAHV